MRDVILLAGVLFGVLFLAFRVMARRGEPFRPGPLVPNADEVVLRELEGSGRHRVMRGSVQPLSPTVFCAKSYHEVRSQIVILQALLVNPSFDFSYKSRARWHAALAGLLDQLDDLTRPFGDDVADGERFARVRRQVEVISLEISRHKRDVDSQVSA